MNYLLTLFHKKKTISKITNFYNITKNIFEENSYLYFIVLLIIFPLFFFIIIPHYSYRTTIEGAYYLLSALVQSEAAIMAIVVSISLIAIQVSTSLYSTRLFDKFRNNPSLWILLLSYIFAIIYTILTLESINNINQKEIFIPKNIEIQIIFSISAAFYCFFVLIIYIYSIFSLLRPFDIIKILSKDITKENLLEGDPCYPLIDMIRYFIEKYDLESIKKVIEAIQHKIIQIMENYPPDQEDDNIFYRLLYIHLLKLSEFVIVKKDQQSANILIKFICEIGQKAIEKQYFNTMTQSGLLLGNIGKEAVKNSLEWTTRRAIANLSLYTDYVEKKVIQITLEEKMSHENKVHFKDILNTISMDLRIIAVDASNKGYKETEQYASSNANSVNKKKEDLNLFNKINLKRDKYKNILSFHS
jgi:hypothetical protein